MIEDDINDKDEDIDNDINNNQIYIQFFNDVNSLENYLSSNDCIVQDKYNNENIYPSIK